MPPEPHRDEHESAAPCFSPGLVQSDEIVLRTIIDPDHLNPDGTLASAAISLEDICFRGWSVDRKRFTSQWRIKLSHSDWKKKKPTIIRCYVLPIPVSEIRRSNPTGESQDFVVTDAAMWLNPAHGAILLSGPKGQGAARGFRNNLLQKFPHYVDVTEVFTRTDRYGFLKGMLGQLRAVLASPFRCIFRSGGH